MSIVRVELTQVIDSVPSDRQAKHSSDSKSPNKPERASVQVKEKPSANALRLWSDSVIHFETMPKLLYAGLRPARQITMNPLQELTYFQRT